MKTIIRLVVIFSLVFISFDVIAATTDTIDLSNVLDTRRVIGVVYFAKNKAGLTDASRAEIDQLVGSMMTNLGERGIVRVEGFSSKGKSQRGELNVALKRARNVWSYVRTKHSVRDNLYLTGFDSQQHISKLQGSRVEIAIYANPFNSIHEGLAKQEGR